MLFNSHTNSLQDFLTDLYTDFIVGQPNFVCSEILADTQRHTKIQVLLLQMVDFTIQG